MRIVLWLAPLLALTPALTGCPATTCTTEAAVSVSVTVLDDSGASVAEAEVVYSVDGGADADCEDFTAGVWACGYEATGEITVTASAPGYDTASETVTVALTPDECHVVGQPVELTLAASTTFAEQRIFVHSLFATEQECEDAQAAGMNCYQIMDLCPDGSGTMMLTDIINPGTYVLDGDTLTSSWSSGDAPPTMVFEGASGDELTDDIWGYAWELTDDPLFGLGSCD